MKQTIRLFQIGLKQTTRDGILLILLPAPVLVGLLFKFFIPFANGMLGEQFSFSLLPWYGLADGMLICLTPMFAAMISSFLLLEELDEGISLFYQITPAGGYSYLTARIVIPMIWAFFMTMAVAGVFNISGLSILTILASSVLSALTGIFLAMIIVSLAKNRVEGLALSKLMGIIFLGLALVWFIPEPYQYLAAFLPTFWVGKTIESGAGILPFTAGLLVCILWIAGFTAKFLRRVI